MVRFFLGMVVVLLVSVSTVRADYPPEVLKQAIALHESRNNDKAIGDKHLANRAYGHLQIRQPCVDDVNRKFGTQYRAEECLGNRSLSEWIFREYINMYATEKNLGREPTLQDMSRIWNGGPKGYKRSVTLPYWQKVQKHLKEIES